MVITKSHREWTDRRLRKKEDGPRLLVGGRYVADGVAKDVSPTNVHYIIFYVPTYIGIHGCGVYFDCDKRHNTTSVQYCYHRSCRRRLRYDLSLVCKYLSIYDHLWATGQNIKSPSEYPRTCCSVIYTPPLTLKSKICVQV